MLKRDISGINILIAAAGGMVGSGWLFSPFISAQIAGSNCLISWVLAAFIMLFIALPLCELGAMLPLSGGMTNYPTFTHGKEIGAIFAWVSWLSYVVMTPIEIQAILQYSSHFFPGLIKDHQHMIELSGLGYLIAIFIMLSIVIINTFGIKLLAECNKYASIIKFLVPIITIISLLYVAPDLSNIKINLSSGQGWKSIFSALSTGGIIFAFTGFQNGLMLAGEVKNPQRNIPIAILGAVLVGFILYFMLQFSFLAALPKSAIAGGWNNLHFTGENGPLVGLTLMLGLGIIAMLLMFDAMFSPLGTTLVYTAATSRILYGMALNQYLPKTLLKLNRYHIPYFTLFVNFLVGVFTFLPLPSWQKMVAFLSSASILSYGIGPICLLALRKLQPTQTRPFKLWGNNWICHLAFYMCNLMLYWCGFSIISKLYIAVLLGLMITRICYHYNLLKITKPLIWFFAYLTSLLLISALGSFGGAGWLHFPLDFFLFLPFSILFLKISQHCLIKQEESESLLSVFEERIT